MTEVQAGSDVPDGRGRTGLDQVGRDLTRNPRVVVRGVEALAMVDTGEIADAKTIMLLQWAALSGPLAAR